MSNLEFIGISIWHTLHRLQFLGRIKRNDTCVIFVTFGAKIISCDAFIKDAEGPLNDLAEKLKMMKAVWLLH